MKITIINATETKDIVFDYLISRLMTYLDSDKADISLFELDGLNINKCTECGSCDKYADEFCTILDDGTNIIEETLSSDYIFVFVPIDENDVPITFRKIFSRIKAYRSIMNSPKVYNVLIGKQHIPDQSYEDIETHYNEIIKYLGFDLIEVVRIRLTKELTVSNEEEIITKLHRFQKEIDLR